MVHGHSRQQQYNDHLCDRLENISFPHCDARVLHAPGECRYCDQHPEWQYLRRLWKINFTGHYDRDLALCPAEYERGIGKVGGHSGWEGNRVAGDFFPDPEDVATAAARLQRIAGELS